MGSTKNKSEPPVAQIPKQKKHTKTFSSKMTIKSGVMVLPPSMIKGKKPIDRMKLA